MAQPSVPKFRKPAVPAAEPPKSEADYMSRSAEVKARGGKKPGRPAVDAPVKALSLSLPPDLILKLNEYARKNTGKNRSMAATELLTKALSE